MAQAIKLDLIRIDGGTQPRAHLNEPAVAEYAELITDGAGLPPVTIYFDGSEYWLADGFHRYHAHRKIGALQIDADVRKGQRRDAVLHSVGANASHGLRRTNEDKRRAVETLLADTEWSQWTDREIAKACGVSHPFVAVIRNPVVAERQQSNRDRNSAKRVERVESDSTPDKSLPVPANSKPVAQRDPVAQAPQNGEYVNEGPSAEEDAFFEEKEKADREAYEALVEAALSDDSLSEAITLIAKQAEEIARLRAELRVVKESRDGYMNGKNEAIRMVKSLQRKLADKEKAAV